MRAQQIHGYYWFGTCVRYLQDVQAGAPVAREGVSGFVRDNLKIFFQYLDNLGLPVTERAASELRDILTELEDKDPDARLTDDEARRLRTVATDVRKTLEAEIKGLEAYVVTPKRLDVKRLIDDPGSLLAPQSIWEVAINSAIRLGRSREMHCVRTIHRCCLPHPSCDGRRVERFLQGTCPAETC